MSDKLPTLGRTKSSLTQKLEAATGKQLAPSRGILSAGNRAVMFAIDCSSSMSGSKIGFARSGAASFARTASERGYAVGVTVFDSAARTLCSPVRAVAEVEQILWAIDADGSTNLALGIALAVQALPSNGERVICIVTDGVPDDRDAAIEAARSAKRQGIEIMAIGTDDADKAFLDLLVTKKELASKVDSGKLSIAIGDMAKLLALPKK